MGIYVEILIRAPLDRLWEHTQDPALHQQWDLRFSEIDYLPKDTADGPQRFRYATRIGLGLPIAGEGESVGQRDLPGGARSSALKFSSSDRRSLIEEGSGYWKYIPGNNGIRFLTWYDYRARFGQFGSLVDRLTFRPLLGWATAWSFDRLRLWLEEGVPPAIALRQACTHGCARIVLAFVFAYQGLVPKLLLHHPDELAMLQAGGIPPGGLALTVNLVGAAELVFAGCLLGFWRARWPAILTLILMILATVGVALNASTFLGAAFNPVALNGAVAGLALVDLLHVSAAPSAGRCLRSPPPSDS